MRRLARPGLSLARSRASCGAAGPAGRLPCGARGPERARNSLHSLRSLRSDKRAQSDDDARWRALLRSAARLGTPQGAQLRARLRPGEALSTASPRQRSRPITKRPAAQQPRTYAPHQRRKLLPAKKKRPAAQQPGPHIQHPTLKGLTPKEEKTRCAAAGPFRPARRALIRLRRAAALAPWGAREARRGGIRPALFRCRRRWPARHSPASTARPGSGGPSRRRCSRPPASRSAGRCRSGSGLAGSWGSW